MRPSHQEAKSAFELKPQFPLQGSGHLRRPRRAGNKGGGLVVEGGKLTLSGENSFSGVTEVASEAELRVTGSLTGDVSVSGLLVVDGDVSGKVTVKEGARLTGSGKVGSLTVAEGGKADPMKTK